MRCGRCGAEILLGAAACERCGASALEAVVEGAPPPPPSRRPARAAPPRPPAQTAAPPPLPPPAGGTRARPARPAGRRAQAPPRRAEVRPSAGCLPLVAVALVGIGAVVSAVLAASDDDAGVRFATTSTGPALPPPSTRPVEVLVAGIPAEGEVPAGGTAGYTWTGEGREVTITVEGVGGFDPTVAVLDATGALLAENDDRAAGDRAAEVAVAPASGQEVLVEVRGFAGTGGAFTVVLR